jgi:TatA/E family protein of Tat protein translocase
MFGTLGGPEIVLILVIALIVFGPRKLPEIGKTMGKMLAEFRKASSDFKRTIEDEVEAEKVLPAVAEGPAPVAVAAGSEPQLEPVPEPQLAPVPPETPTVSRLEGDRIQPPAAMETPSRLEPPAPLDSTRDAEPAEAPVETAAEIKPA